MTSPSIPLLLLAVALTACTAGTHESAAPTTDEDPAARIRAEAILADVEVLSDDDMEGRLAGTAGAAKAATYLAERYEQIGLEPVGGPGESYLLPVELVGMTKDGDASSVEIEGPGGAVELVNDETFTYWSTAEKPVVDLDDVPIVFVGYGVEAPEHEWDDFKGADLAGKVLLFLNNDPAVEEDGQALFGGEARTYYGRWTYKFEQADKIGAAGAIVVHTLESASYPFSVIGSSGARRIWQRTYQLDFLAWADENVSAEIVSAMGTTVPGLFEMANRRDFEPVDTGYRLSAHLETSIERVEDSNVAGMVRGSDPELADEYVLFSAHYDHMGVKPELEGDDKIFNGALDNALGVAAMMAAAEAATAAEPRRSMIFLATTAEEGGLLGGAAFARNPPVPLRQIVANINIDSPQSFGLTHDVGAIGLEMSDLGRWFAEIAAAEGLTAKGDPNPNAGSFYRSDQLNFAKAGIPALYLQRGTDFVAELDFDPEALRLENYHQVSDEILPEWDLAGIERDMKVLFATALKAATEETAPRWVAGHEFEEEWKELYGIEP